MIGYFAFGQLFELVHNLGQQLLGEQLFDGLICDLVINMCCIARCGDDRHVVCEI
jgi:hypothetical protein